MGMINSKMFPEGEILLRWMDNRFKKNKNVITVTTGPTGSGKSYCDLRKAELHYRRMFKEDFPIENCCFSVAELMERIQSKELRQGEILILEEAGVNAGSGDWQTKVVKMFNYLLQSFRSMNIGIFLNLPVLSMLSKQARQLVHMHMETTGIDFELGICKIKPLYHQLNQHSGKSYWKYMRVKAKDRVVSVERMGFSMPSQELLDKYEAKKTKFLAEMTEDFVLNLRKMERDKLAKVSRKDLNEDQKEIIKLRKEGKTLKEIGEILERSPATIWERIETLKKNGFWVEKRKKRKKKVEN